MFWNAWACPQRLPVVTVDIDHDSRFQWINFVHTFKHYQLLTLCAYFACPMVKIYTIRYLNITTWFIVWFHVKRHITITKFVIGLVGRGWELCPHWVCLVKCFTKWHFHNDMRIWLPTQGLCVCRKINFLWSYFTPPYRRLLHTTILKWHGIPLWCHVYITVEFYQ